MPAFYPASAARFSQRMQRGGFRVNEHVSKAVGELGAADASNRAAVLSTATRLLSLFGEPKPPKDLILEALAVSSGYRDWNTFSGCLKRKDGKPAQVASPVRDDDEDLDAIKAKLGIGTTILRPDLPTTRDVWFEDAGTGGFDSSALNHFPKVSRKRPPKVDNSVFHVVEIGDWVFHGILSIDGPYIICHGPARWTPGGCALGVSDLRWFNPALEREGEGWYLVKYGNQPHVKLTGMDDAMILRLAHEFGFALEDHRSRAGLSPIRRFLASPAWPAAVGRQASAPCGATLRQRRLHSWMVRGGLGAERTGGSGAVRFLTAPSGATGRAGAAAGGLAAAQRFVARGEGPVR